jgi:hypothetical protein
VKPEAGEALRLTVVSADTGEALPAGSRLCSVTAPEQACEATVFAVLVMTRWSGGAGLMVSVCVAGVAIPAPEAVTTGLLARTPLKEKVPVLWPFGIEIEVTDAPPHPDPA